jgi:hypothetical protein
MNSRQYARTAVGDISKLIGAEELDKVLADRRADEFRVKLGRMLVIAAWD